MWLKLLGCGSYRLLKITKQCFPYQEWGITFHVFQLPDLLLKEQAHQLNYDSYNSSALYLLWRRWFTAELWSLALLMEAPSLPVVQAEINHRSQREVTVRIVITRSGCQSSWQFPCVFMLMVHMSRGEKVIFHCLKCSWIPLSLKLETHKSGFGGRPLCCSYEDYFWERVFVVGRSSRDIWRSINEHLKVLFSPACPDSGYICRDFRPYTECTTSSQWDKTIFSTQTTFLFDERHSFYYHLIFEGPHRTAKTTSPRVDERRHISSLQLLSFLCSQRSNRCSWTPQVAIKTQITYFVILSVLSDVLCTSIYLTGRSI